MLNIIGKKSVLWYKNVKIKSQAANIQCLFSKQDCIQQDKWMVQIQVENCVRSIFLAINKAKKLKAGLLESNLSNTLRIRLLVKWK